MVFIYALISGQLVLYVGQTNDTKRRVYEHKAKNNNCTSKYIPDYTDWTMKILEETTDALGTQREQYFYDTLRPLYNYQRPGQIRQDYHDAYTKTDAFKISQKAYKQSEAGRASQKAYRQTEAHKAYQKAYKQSEAGKASQKASMKAYYHRKKLNSVQD